MKLTIKNYEKIIGTYGNYSIVNAVELPDYYSFTVKDGDAVRYKDIVVKRDGRIDNDGEWIYHFRQGSRDTQCVTPKWFGDKGNAVGAIISEYETI